MSRSLVAGVNALFRATESKRPPASRLLFDPWAGRLAENDPRVAGVRCARFVHPRLFRMIDELETAHCVRHRSIDELILAAIRRHGYRQIVTLGAGYDMRASRFASIAGEVGRAIRWLELDRSETLERKRRLLEGAGGLNTAVESIAHDLLAGPLDRALAATSLDQTEPACFVLEGVIHYLTPAALDATLAAIRAHRAKVCVVLSFIRSDVYVRAPSLFIRLVKLLHEIPRLHFTRESLQALATRHGLSCNRTWAIEEQLASFAPEGRGRRLGLSQDVALLEGEML